MGVQYYYWAPNLFRWTKNGKSGKIKYEKAIKTTSKRKKKVGFGHPSGKAKNQKQEDQKVKNSEFERLVREALLEMPGNIRQKMDNIEVVIEKGSPRSSLLGLYQGVPKTAWGRGFGMRLPDKITIFQEPLERIARSPEELKEIVKDTVWHEVAHHFGFDEKGVRTLERKRKNK